MHQLLHATQQRSGNWIGSSLIHLGDSNVPNALMFIDKYTQISRILNPILSCHSLGVTGPLGQPKRSELPSSCPLAEILRFGP